VSFGGFIATRRDPLLAGGIAALWLVEVFTETGFGGHEPLAVAAALAMSASLLVRRTRPAIPLILGLGVIELANRELQPLAETAAFLVAFLTAIYSAGAHTERREAIVCALLVLASIPLAAIEPGEDTAIADVGFFVVFFTGPFVVGRVMRHRRARDLIVVAESEERAREAVGEERARIARELHDVVAHAVSIMVLQARGARKVMATDAPAARTALDTIERSGSEALTEMRRLLGMLRQGDEELALAPQPSLRRIEELVDGVRRAGLPVELDVEGDLGDLPPGADISAYRIIQEALTNALKHAGPARARVRVARTAGELEIVVSDDGAAGGADSSMPSGHGLEGIRERVAVYGGRLSAGERPEGGYALSARLPLDGPG